MFRLFKRDTLEEGNDSKEDLITRSDVMQTYNGVMRSNAYFLSYYNEWGTNINPQHVIVRLLHILKQYRGTTDDVVRKVSNDLNAIVVALGLTGDYNYGNCFYDTFYSRHCFILAVDFGYIDYSTVPFMDLRPIRVLTHQSTDSRFVLPQFTKITDPGVSIIGIDIVQLAVMFKLWRVDNNKHGVKLNMSMLLTKFVIPNMINEQFDIAMRNKLIDLSNTSSVSYPIPTGFVVKNVSDSSTRLHTSFNTILNLCNSHKKNFSYDLRLLPMMFSGTLLDAIPLDIAIVNYGSYWVHFMLYLDWVWHITNALKGTYQWDTEVNKSRVFHQIDMTVKMHNVFDRMPPLVKDIYLVRYEDVKKRFGYT